MKITINSNLHFQRALKSKEEKDYLETLNLAKKKLGTDGKSVLIVPASALPQQFENNTGVGNMASEDAFKFYDFAKKYWGIKEIQILPIGQYHKHKYHYPFYSGTSLDLGNQVINIKDFVSNEEFKKIVQNNNTTTQVNFANVIEPNSTHEIALKKLYEKMPQNLSKEFEKFKTQNNFWLEPKALYQALTTINKHHNYKKWNELDKNLYNEEIINCTERNKRISEINLLQQKNIDFYKFKQFLAEKSLKKAKDKLNADGLKLYGDMLCGFSYDEVWAHPKAFIENSSINWGLPAADFNSQAAKELLRKKVNLFANRFDGIRVDASWTYITPNINDLKTGKVVKKDYQYELLDLIDDEFKRVKGNKFDKKDIMHEFIASLDDFSIVENGTIKKPLDDRVKIYTSKDINPLWKNGHIFSNIGADNNSFLIGVRNHDSSKIEFNKNNAKILAEYLKLPQDKINNLKKYTRAKLIEASAVKNQMLFYMDGLGINEAFLRNNDPTKDYVHKISTNYFKDYIEKLKKGEAYNPMDAMQVLFEKEGLNKTEKKLYKKIKKYNKILKQKNDFPNKILYCSLGITSLLYASYTLIKNNYFGNKKRKD